MAEAVARAMVSAEEANKAGTDADDTPKAGEHLLVQAGTGTGKSLAYLVPAVLHSVRTGDHVVVATATIALQRQLVERDLPLVADALEAADAPATDVRDPQGAPPLPVSAPAQRRTAARRRQRGPVRPGTDHGARPGRTPHPRLGRRHQDRRPRRAGARPRRAGLARAERHGPRVHRRRPMPLRRHVFLRAGSRRRQARGRRRHQPRDARDRRGQRHPAAARARRGHRRRGSRAGRPGDRGHHRRAHRPVWSSAPRDAPGSTSAPSSTTSW